MKGTREEFRYLSRDKMTEIRAVEWIPEGEVKAVLQIAHGMAEHMDRYDEFASFLCDRGYYVVGNDHLGHGGSVQSKKDLGYFHEVDGSKLVLKDIHTLRMETIKRFGHVPYFMLGHSMGSFLIRQYIIKYGVELDGVILVGTAHQPPWMLSFAMMMCKMIASIRGWHHRSKLIHFLVFSSNNRKFSPTRTKSDWLSKDDDRLGEYLADEYCGFVFTVNGYYHLFSWLKGVGKKGSITRVAKAKGLPIFIASGKDDAVGDFGQGVKKVYQGYKKAGIVDLSIRLYKDSRHEILNETNRDQVYEEIYQWIDCRL